jgi:D-tyrosyl-tRNA(Tyr) deacylase
LRAVIQRSQRAAVSVEGEVVGEIPFGLCMFIGVGPDDNDTIARHFADRIATLRIFKDAEGKTNLDVRAAGGQILAISQFTLFADTSRGHRPSFIRAGAPEHAEPLFDIFVEALRGHGLTVATGRFGAYMDVDVANDGPTTIVLTSGEPDWPADAG